MVSDSVLKALYQEAYKFVHQRSGEDFLHDNLHAPTKLPPEKMQDVFRHLISSLMSTKRIRETIADIESMSDLVFGFDITKMDLHHGDDWWRLFNEIKDKYQPSGMDIDNPRNCWVIFCKGIISGVSFLCEIGTVEGFDAFVKGFWHDDMTMAGLPLLLQYEIGCTFPMACQFLCNCGYPDFVEPNASIKKILFDTGVIESRDNYETFNSLIRIGRVNQERPAFVHRVFSLIGSDSIDEDGNRKANFSDEFIKHIVPVLNLPHH